MKKAAFAFAAGLVLLAGGNAHGAAQTLSQFMSLCNRDDRVCRAKIGDYIASASLQKYICMPEDLSQRDATSMVMDKLREDRSDPVLNQNFFEDQAWSAVSTLWPCKPEAPASSDTAPASTNPAPGSTDAAPGTPTPAPGTPQ